MMNFDNLESFLSNHGVSFEKETNLAKKTWIKTGGTCSFWIVPDSIGQLTDLCKYLYANNLDFDIVGQTSNLFFHSTYNPQIVVSTVKVNHYVIEGDIIICDCGVNVVKLARECLGAGYAGFYGLVGLPGTVASSVYGNAGCFGCSIGSMLISVDVLLPEGVVITIRKEDLKLSVRSSAFKQKQIQGVILSVKLKTIKAEDCDEELRKAEQTIKYRKEKQEGPNHNLGSMFSQRIPRKNLKNIFASALSTFLSVTKLTKSRNKIYKRLLLSFYGYKDLAPYISDKTINTFVWKNENAEAMFERYKEFMGRVHNKLVIEIEERL